MNREDGRSGCASTPREDVYSRVTARIVADLERGTRPRMKPWSAAIPPGGTPYGGMNVLLL